MAGKPVIMVIGASGNIGMSTLKALASQYADKFTIRAGVRNPDTADSVKAIQGVTVVKATMGDKTSLSSTLKTVDRLFIVTPGIEDRADVTIATAQAAKIAGVKSILIVSVSNADLSSTVFGRQFTQIETQIKTLGVPYTFLRLPLFMENYFAAQGSIKNESCVYMPLDPTKPYTPVAVTDAGKAAAAILALPAQHAGKTYNLVSNRHTINEVCSVFSSHLGKTISYVRVSYDAAKKAFMQNGFPEWQTDGILDLYRLIDSGSDVTNQSDLTHYRTITGFSPMSLEDWISEMKMAFE